MIPACQEIKSIFAISALAWLGGIDIFADQPAPTPAVAAVAAAPVTVAAWAPRPFADVVLDTPELAGCFLLLPGAWASAQPPAALAEPAALAGAVGSQLAGLHGGAPSARLSVIVVEIENAELSAVASGATALLVLPKGAPLSLEEAARTVVAAVIRTTLTPAAPDPRCSEPLLAFGEAIAVAGRLTLATLPPALRPVQDWLELRDAAAPLDALVREALDRAEPWATRRVRLQLSALASSANASLLNAAARVVEAFGDPERAAREPFELLLAWRENRGHLYPPASNVLRRAIAAPLVAGMPDKSHPEDERLVAADALRRRIECGKVASIEGAEHADVPLRLLAAAQARATGAGTACPWVLAAPLAASLPTGCRSDEKRSSYVAVRPRPGGFEIFAATASDESLLLRWPGWVLFPFIARDAGMLVFSDQAGIWAVPLDSNAPPQELAGGSFRHLAPAPNGKRLAAVRWPDGALAIVTLAAEVRVLGGDARGGVAWIDDELLLTAGREGAAVVSSLGGGAKPLPGLPRCVRTVARQGPSLLLGVAAPCESGIVQVQLGAEAGKVAVKRTDGPLGILPLADGGIVFGEADGIMRWRPGEEPARLGGGLTPGPG